MKSLRWSHFHLIFIITFVVCVPSSARWGSQMDAAIRTKSDVAEVFVREDGTWKSTRDSVYIINNEQGRAAFGTSLIKYNSRTTKITDVKAESRTGSEKIGVDKEYIEDKPIASSAEGFDESRQISIAYPNVEVGTELYLSYRTDTTEVPVPGLYSEEFVFGEGSYDEGSSLSLHTPFPLHIEKHDPQQSLEVVQKPEGKGFLTQVRLLKPIYTEVVDELEPQVSRRHTTWLVVSTSKDWGALARPLVGDYEKVLQAELPERYAEIAKEAKALPQLNDQIDLVTSKLADSVRYLGDWRSVRGGHVPRPLALVARTRFGDCKDFAAGTVAILRKLGHEAYVAWVNRELQPDILPALPVDTAFNHAIVYLKEKDRVRWIDPTNIVSFARGTFEDIMGRQALVVDPKNPRLEWISEGLPTDAANLRQLAIRFQKNGNALLEATLDYQGRSAVTLTGLERQLSKETIKHFITKGLAEEQYLLASELADFDLRSRLVKDVRLKAKLTIKRYSIRTTAGSAYAVPRGGLGKLIDLEPAPRVSDFFLGFPGIDRVAYRLHAANIVGKLPTGCQIKSPWLDFQRKYQIKAGEITITDELKILRSSIPVDAIHGKTFTQLQHNLEDCIHKISIVFKP